MNTRTLFTLALTSFVFVACGGGEPGEEDMAPATEQATAPPAETPAPPPAEPETPPAQTEPTPPTRPAAPRMDEPYEPVYSGTVSPGMSRDDVVQVWGEPIAERVAGSYQYLYYRNGCEVSCGTFDVVFLQNGAVIDAIVRGPGHEYAGTSSSPAGSEGMFTPPVPGMN